MVHPEGFLEAETAHPFSYTIQVTQARAANEVLCPCLAVMSVNDHPYKECKKHSTGILLGVLSPYHDFKQIH